MGCFFPAFCYTSPPGWTLSLWNCEPGQALSPLSRVDEGVLSQQGEGDEDSTQAFPQVFCFDLLSETRSCYVAEARLELVSLPKLTLISCLPHHHLTSAETIGLDDHVRLESLRQHLFSSTLF